MSTPDELTDPFEYLKNRRLKYIHSLERIAERGTPLHGVRVNALKILLNKTMADQTKIEVTTNKSPWEMLQEMTGGDDAEETSEVRKEGDGEGDS